MKGLLRALLFGASLSLALIALVPIVFWLSPEIAPPAERAWAVGASSAFCIICIGYRHMEGNAVARDFIMANRHHRMDSLVQPSHLHN
jgi:hypothetical protein